jgi:hypothetical protein
MDDCKNITLFKGSDGRTILNGSGVPGAGLGNNGDFYIDTASWDIYGPKTAGAWGAGTSLIGTTGGAGAQGVYGGWSSEWDFDSATTANPGTGEFRFDNASPASATNLYIHKTNGDSTVLTNFLAAWASGGAVRISKKDDPNVFWMGTITTSVANLNDYTFGVTTTLANGSFVDTNEFVVSYVQIGATGATGAAGAAGIDLYDSDWVNIGNHNGTFGLAPVTNWTQPKLRVIGKHVYISGKFLIPLDDGVGGLVVDSSVYDTTHKAKVGTYAGVDGGFNTLAAGALRSQNPIIPSDLTPSTDHNIETWMNAYRAVGDKAGTRTILLNTVFPTVLLESDGRVYIQTLKDVTDTVGTRIPHGIIHNMITNVSADDYVPDWTNYGTGYTKTTSGTLEVGKDYVIETFVAGDDFTNVGAPSNATGVAFVATGTTPTTWANASTLRADNRFAAVSTYQYPSDFDGKDETELGGVIIEFTFNYPLGESVTEAQIQAAIASM